MFVFFSGYTVLALWVKRPFNHLPLSCFDLSILLPLRELRIKHLDGNPCLSCFCFPDWDELPGLHSLAVLESKTMKISLPSGQDFAAWQGQVHLFDNMDFLSWNSFSSPQFITHPCGSLSSGGRLQIWPKHLFNQPVFLYSGSFVMILSKISDLINDI